MNLILGTQAQVVDLQDPSEIKVRVFGVENDKDANPEVTVKHEGIMVAKVNKESPFWWSSSIPFGEITIESDTENTVFEVQ